MDDFCESISFAQANNENLRIRDLAIAKRQQIAASEGGLSEFRQGLEVRSLVTPEENADLAEYYASHSARSTPLAGIQSVIDRIDDRLNSYHDVLKTAFPIHGELVGKSSFLSALTHKNFDPTTVAMTGKRRYFCVGVYGPDAPEKPIGALGLQVFINKEDEPVTIHSSYYALTPEYRGVAPSAKVLEETTKLVVGYIKEVAPQKVDKPIYNFIETTSIDNTPAGAYLMDHAHSMNPIGRAGMWNGRNFAPLNFHYAQRNPEGGDPITLTLSAQQINIAQKQDGQMLVQTERPTEIPTEVVQRHVLNFDTHLMNYNHVHEALLAGKAYDDAFNDQMRNAVSAGSIGGVVKALTPQLNKAGLKSAMKRIEYLSNYFGDRPLSLEEVATPISELYDKIQGRTLSVSTQAAVKPVAESAKPTPAKSAGTAPRVSGQSALATSMQAALKKVQLKPSPITGGGGGNDNVQLSAQIRTEDGKTIISEGSKRGGRG